MADHGTRQSYGEGCRCAPCKAAGAAYRREYKLRKSGALVDLPVRRTGRPPKNAPKQEPVKIPEPGTVGSIERATLEELQTLTSSETRKAAAGAAVAMARILDNPLALAQQPAAAGRLESLMESLRKGSARRKGRLASVQAMTRPKQDSATG